MTLTLAITVVLAIVLVIILKFNKNKHTPAHVPVTAYILPFSYQLTNYQMADKSLFFDFLDRYPDNLTSRRINDIVNTSDCKYKPTWGAKINKHDQTKVEYELYCYNYLPTERKRDRCGETLSFQKICKIMGFPMCNQESVMFSFDLDQENEPPNFYYIDCVHSDDDVGVSKKNGIIQNKYYRYKPNCTVGQFSKYLNKEYVPLDHGPDIKVVFFADKLKRNYIGAYYDGVTFETLQKVISDTGFGPFDFLSNEKYYDKRYSVSIDYDKKTGEIMRIGIYGILY